MSKQRQSPRRVAAFVAALWGEDGASGPNNCSVIAVRRAARGRISVGKSRGADCIVEAVECAPFELARVDGGTVVVTVPEGAEARRGSFATLDAAPCDPSDRTVGPASVVLAYGEEICVRAGALCLLVSAVEAEAPRPRCKRERGAGLHVLVAAVLHAVLLGISWQGAAAAEALADDAPAAERMRRWMASAERRAVARERAVFDPDTGDGGGRNINELPGDGRPGGGAKAAGVEGAVGDTMSRSGAARRFALPKTDERDRQLSREEAHADAASFGMIGLLATERATPDAIFGDVWAHGADDIAARGAMWSHAIGEAPGSGGLGLRGIGEGGGGLGEGIGLGGIGVGHTVGAPGDGTGGRGPQRFGFGQGFSSGWGRLSGSHRSSSPVIRCGCGGLSVSGRLPPETVQRIVRQNFGRFRRCYERGLRTQPALAGRVTTKFLIDGRGLVASAQNAGSDLADPTVVSCVVAAFRTLQFPELPGNDLVGVTYPIVFAPE